MGSVNKFQNISSLTTLTTLTTPTTTMTSPLTSSPITTKQIRDSPSLITKKFSSQGNSKYDSIGNLAILLREKFKHFYILFHDGNAYVVDHGSNRYIIIITKKTPKTTLATVFLPNTFLPH